MHPSHSSILAPTLTREDLAACLHRSKASIDRDDQLGRLPRAIRIGQRKLWRRAEVEAWLEAGCPDRKTLEAMRRKA